MTLGKEFLQQLRAQIEARHEKLLDALATLEQLELGDKYITPRRRGSTRTASSCAPTAQPTSDRECVLSALTGEWQTVEEITNTSGLDSEQVRGVVHVLGQDESRIEVRRTSWGEEFREVQPG